MFSLERTAFRIHRAIALITAELKSPIETSFSFCYEDDKVYLSNSGICGASVSLKMTKEGGKLDYVQVFHRYPLLRLQGGPTVYRTGKWVDHILELKEEAIRERKIRRVLERHKRREEISPIDDSALFDKYKDLPLLETKKEAPKLRKYVYEVYPNQEIPDDHDPELDCCCNCVFHLEDHSHPCSDGKSVSEKKGYICLLPAYMMKKKGEKTKKFAQSGWHKHGMCEMHCREEDGFLVELAPVKTVTLPVVHSEIGPPG